MPYYYQICFFYQKISDTVAYEKYVQPECVEDNNVANGDTSHDYQEAPSRAVYCCMFYNCYYTCFLEHELCYTGGILNGEFTEEEGCNGQCDAHDSD